MAKTEKHRWVAQIRQILSRDRTSSNCLELAANEWGLKPCSADFDIHEANRKIAEDFNIGRKEYTAQLLQVLHQLMEKRAQTNQMGAVTAAVAQAIKLARPTTEHHLSKSSQK